MQITGYLVSLGYRLRGNDEWIKEGLIKSVRGEYFPFAPSIHRTSAALGTNGKFIEPWPSDLIRPSLKLRVFLRAPLGFLHRILQRVLLDLLQHDLFHV